MYIFQICSSLLLVFTSLRLRHRINLAIRGLFVSIWIVEFFPPISIKNDIGRGWCQQRWWNKRFPAYIFPSNNYLAAIREQKCLCGSFGIQVGGCEIPIKSKIEKSCFEKAGLHPGGRFAEHSPSYRPKASPLLWTQLQQPGYAPQISATCHGTWEELFLRIRHTNGQQVYEKVLNITNHQGSANQNNSEISPHTC